MSMAVHLKRAAERPQEPTVQITVSKPVLTPSQSSLLASLRSGYKLLHDYQSGRYVLNNPSLQGVTYSARVLLSLGYLEKVATCSTGCEYVLVEGQRSK